MRCVFSQTCTSVRVLAVFTEYGNVHSVHILLSSCVARACRAWCVCVVRVRRRVSRACVGVRGADAGSHVYVWVHGAGVHGLVHVLRAGACL